MKQRVGVVAASDRLAQDRIGQVAAFAELECSTYCDRFRFTDTFESGDQFPDCQFSQCIQIIVCRVEDTLR